MFFFSNRHYHLLIVLVVFFKYFKLSCVEKGIKRYTSVLLTLKNNNFEIFFTAIIKNNKNKTFILEKQRHKRFQNNTNSVSNKNSDKNSSMRLFV